MKTPLFLNFIAVLSLSLAPAQAFTVDPPSRVARA